MTLEMLVWVDPHPLSPASVVPSDVYANLYSLIVLFNTSITCKRITSTFLLKLLLPVLVLH